MRNFVPRPSALGVIAALLTTATVAASGTATLYSQDFESSRGGFAVGGLWDRVDSSICLGESGFALYYGDDDCNYDTGGPSTGNATSPVISLVGISAPVTLTFRYLLETERGDFGPVCVFDLAEVLVSNDGFATSTLLADQGCGAPETLDDPSSGWQTATIDLSAFAGDSIQIRFHFDTVDGSFNDFLGWAVDDIELTIFGDDLLSLEAPPCPDDADAAPGQQVAVELWMRNPTQFVTGFQAFVEYDTALLDFRGDLSSYTIAPFPDHIIPVAFAEGPPGTLTLAGNETLGGPGIDVSSHFATLIFDVLDGCASTEVAFSLGGLFDSELSYVGLPLATKLSNSGIFSLDDAAPIFSICPTDISVPAYVQTPLCLISDCCIPSLGTGCNNAACTAIVCGLDAFCCDTLWDAICADEAIDSCPADFGPCAGSPVSYPAPSASDACGGPVIVTCSHASGGFFPVGTTTVTCTATDECGNIGLCTFDITVTPTNLVDVAVELAGSMPTSRCIHFVVDDCSVTADSVLSFVGAPATAMGTIEIDCGDWTQLCAKDAQHTTWDTVALLPALDRWIVASTLVLMPGDDDNDGDVDINDVTWLVATYASFAAPGGCPFVTNTPRDADFSNNGVVFGEDYSLLSGQFLSTSSCACASPAEAAGGGVRAKSLDRRVAIPVAELSPLLRSADLDGDQVFDWRDVAEFERRVGLPEDLSRRMRAVR